MTDDNSADAGDDRTLPGALAARLTAGFRADRPTAGDDALAEFLAAMAEAYLVLKRRFDALDADAAHMADADAAIQTGDFEAADDHLAAAETASPTDGVPTRVRVRKRADIRELRGAVALLAGDIEVAARRFVAAAALVRPADAEAGRRSDQRAVQALHDHGRRHGGPALDRALELVDAGLKRIDQYENPEDWAQAQAARARLCSSLGARTQGDAGALRFGEAAAGHQAALTVWTETKAPARWAATQNNLANARRAEAARSAKAERARLLGDAADAYRAALSVWTEAAAPERSAATQINLAAVLRDLDAE